MHWKTKLLIERQIERIEKNGAEYYCSADYQFEHLVAITIIMEKYKELMKEKDGK